VNRFISLPWLQSLPARFVQYRLRPGSPKLAFCMRVARPDRIQQREGGVLIMVRMTRVKKPIRALHVESRQQGAGAILRRNSMRASPSAPSRPGSAPVLAHRWSRETRKTRRDASLREVPTGSCEHSQLPPHDHDVVPTGPRRRWLPGPPGDGRLCMANGIVPVNSGSGGEAIRSWPYDRQGHVDLSAEEALQQLAARRRG